MDGIFKKPPRRRLPFALFLIVIGGYLCARFSVWTLNALRTGQIASALFTILFGFFGLCLVGFGGFVLFHHQGAYLRADGEVICEKNGILNSFSFSTKEIDTIALSGCHIVFRLKDGRCIFAGRLENAEEMYKFIEQKIPPYEYPDSDQCKAKYVAAQFRIVLFNLAITFLCVLFLVAFALFVYSTFNKTLAEFDLRETKLAIIFSAEAIFTVIAVVHLSKLLGRQKEIAAYYREKWICAEAFHHRVDNLDAYIHPLEVLYFADYSYRIVICTNLEKNFYSYMLERFHLKSEQWIMCLDHFAEFTHYEDMLDKIEGRYSDVEFSVNKLKFALSKDISTPQESFPHDS